MSEAVAPIQKSTGAGAIVREGFAGREVERRGETASSALAVQARAEIEARYLMAMQRPRNFDDVRIALLKECKRPGFAQHAIYQVPRAGAVGKLTGTRGVVEGLSIRFAESAARITTNLYVGKAITYDDDFKRIVRVSCIDLESNNTESEDLEIEKTTERRDLKDGRVVLGKRENSAGETVYIVQATEEELLQKQRALAQRAKRNGLLAILPSDIRDECEKAVVQTRRDATASDPDGARKEIADGFAAIGIMPSDLGQYLGCDLAAATPKQLEELRGLYVAVREGDTTFPEALKAVTTVRDVPAQGEAADDPQRTQAQRLTEKIRERGKKIAESRKAAAPAPAGAAPAQAAAQTAKAPPAKAAPKQAPAAAPAAPPAESCMICKKPIVGASVETTDNVGVVGSKHPACEWPGRQRQPGED